MLRLINLETGEIMEVDEYAGRERGFPEGYVWDECITTEDWINALQRAINKKEKENGMLHQSAE